MVRNVVDDVTRQEFTTHIDRSKGEKAIKEKSNGVVNPTSCRWHLAKKVIVLLFRFV